MNALPRNALQGMAFARRNMEKAIDAFKPNTNH